MVTWRVRAVVAGVVAVLAAGCSAGPAAPQGVPRKALHQRGTRPGAATGMALHERSSHSGAVTLAFAGDVNFFGRTARLLRREPLLWLAVGLSLFPPIVSFARILAGRAP